MLAHQAEDDLRRDTFSGRNIVSSSGQPHNPEHSFRLWLLFLYLKGDDNHANSKKTSFRFMAVPGFQPQ